MKTPNYISKLKRFVIISLCLLTIFNAKGEDLFFSTLSMRDGLPSNIIAGITQDKYDFIWVGTGSGLARYDGNNFKVFKKTESEKSLPSNEITTILANDEFVWVGSWYGLCKINIKTFEVTRIDLGKANTIRALHKGKQGILWIGTANGLIRYSLKTDEFQTLNHSNSGLSHNMVRSIYEDMAGNLWVGTYDKLNKLAFNEDTFFPISLNTAIENQPKNHLILDIKAASQIDSVLWIGTETGLFKLNTDNHTSKLYSTSNAEFSNEVIKCIYVGNEDKIWLGTDFGLNTFEESAKLNATHFHNPQLPYSITNNVIWQIFEDKGGVIWFVTSNGLSRVNTYGNFYSFNEISYKIENQTIGNQVKSFLTSTSNIYWLATQHGVIRIDPSKNTKTTFSTNSPKNRRILLDNTYALEEDQFGRIWIGTAGGINIWDEKSHTMHTITANAKNGLSSNYVGKFSKQPDGTLWVSSWQGGLYRIKGDLSYPPSIEFEAVPLLESGSEKHVFGAGYMWLIEYDKLYRIDPQTLTSHYVKSFDMITANNSIYSIYFSKKGHLWASTLNGLIQYLPKKDQAIFHPIVSGDAIIATSITEDDHGNIWSTTNTALQKLYIDDQHVEIYPLDKNLPIKNFYYGCASHTNDGQIAFGGDNGYIIFSPKKVVPNRYTPSVWVTALDVNNKRIDVNETLNERVLLNNDVAFTKDIILEFNERSIALEFTSLHFWQPTMNVYTYKLEGFDENWNYVSGKKNFAIYSNLEPGRYQFRVKGSNNYGIESDTETTLNIKIKPPFFLSTFFLALYACIIILLIYLALRAYSIRVHLKNQLKISKLEKEHAEEIEQTKEHFFTNISHELRTPISLILPPIHEIQKKGKLDQDSHKLISLAEKNSVRLLRLVNQILDFNKIENDTLQIKVSSIEIASFCQEVFSLFRDKAERSQIDFIFNQKTDHEQVWLDLEKIETVLFNLLSNAFKFTPKGGEIELSLSCEKESTEFKEGALIIQIQDTGIGISDEDQAKIFDRFYQAEDGKKKTSSSGIGLTLAAEYVELHQGRISVESIIGKGTTFTVHLPLGKAHFPIDTIQSGDKINLLAKRSVHGRKEGSKYYQLDLASDKPLVLIIEDNNDMVDFIRNSLSHKYNFVSAENGQEGFQKANNFSPQVIISDIMMPVMDGIALCKKVKENPKTSHVSIILLTAKSLTSNRVEGIKVGADAYITKPFEIDLLEAHIDHLIQRKQELTTYFKNELIRLPSKTDASNNEDKKFVKRVMDIIEANISNSDLTVEMISNEMAMSTTHLYRKLKATTNRSAKEIIHKYRLKKASLLLQNREGNITEIMYQVGFSSLSYFSKCFKAEYKLSPKKFQEKMDTKSI